MFQVCHMAQYLNDRRTGAIPSGLDTDRAYMLLHQLADPESDILQSAIRYKMKDGQDTSFQNLCPMPTQSLSWRNGDRFSTTTTTQHIPNKIQIFVDHNSLRTYKLSEMEWSM